MTRTRARGRTIALLALVAGLVLLAVSGVAWALRATPAPAPAVPGPAISGPASPGPVSRGGVVPEPVAAGPSAAPRGEVEPAAAPVGLTVERAGETLLAAPVVPVGVDAAGAMGVPRDVDTVGWYRFGAAPGAGTGSALLAGHVDDREQGLGAFHDLGGLVPGDLVTVRRDGAPPIRYAVREVRSVAKDALAAEELVARAGPPRLTLVTCGGPFDRQTRSYRDNVVVVALPAPATP
ncbi:class F sortase [Pseudonocardia sp. RS010]|uniref:class F sortase n=1 Tax=Pseudonocardia sp. RS010 TaxID=3385979 RepID=UPI0039A27BC7